MSAWLLPWFVLAATFALLSAAFSAVETAIFSMNEERRRKLRARHPRRAAALEELMRRPDRVGDTLALANMLANLPLLVLVLLLVDLLGFHDSLSEWGFLLLGFGVVVIICDLLPKLVALAAPVRITGAGLPLVRRLLPLLSPITGFLQRSSEGIVRRLAPRRAAPLGKLTDEELETLVEIGREEGTFAESESRVLREVMKLRGETAKHCMTPRVDAFILPDDLTNAEAADRVRRKRYRFAPVRGETPDDILGLLDVKDFLLHPSASHYTERLQPPSFVPETTKALDLLRAFLGHRQHLAILLDEYGGIEGLVTMSDLVEELLGEEGTAGGGLYIERIGDGKLLVAGTARLDDLEESIGLRVDSADLETIGGLVVGHFGTLPKPGESFTHGDWRITVRRSTRSRVREVLLEPLTPESTGEGAGI